jgi:ATP-binding cassette subfamily A (ABC1) protein 3
MLFSIVRRFYFQIYLIELNSKRHDILYPDLTVYEHLELIALIKGYPQKLISGEIKRITTYVGLHDNLHKRSKELSGGMKRRLSVAMSFTGDSKVIIM